MYKDTQEACNKYFKKICEIFSRNPSREKTMEDVFLVSSYPFISSCRKLPEIFVTINDESAFITRGFVDQGRFDNGYN